LPIHLYDSRADELRHIEAWAKKNNLDLNKSKTKEVVFILYDSRTGA